MNNIMRWQPFGGFDNLFGRFGGRFDEAALLRLFGDEKLEWTPTADITETDKEYVIKADLPEVKKEDINVSLDKGMITITGERKREREQKDERVHSRESYYGRFARSFSLPEDVDPSAISAETKDGVLRVRLPKQKTAKQKPVQVQIR